MARPAHRGWHALVKALLLAGPFLFADLAMAQAIPVELRQTDQGWSLYRGGEPYFISGAGGDHSLRALAAAGANSVRTWGAENVGVILDEAHALGLTVTIGIWLGHERHGFDYDDAAQVAEQFERARDIVLKYRDHPALLLWGLGNEMEGFEDGDNPAIWKAVNDIGAMVKELDPNHPTMTVTAFVHGKRIEYLHRRSPSIDIHGVNAYGGASVVHERLREGGGSKPFVLTEYGPPGPWEVPTTDWGAPYEPTSSEKADFYRHSYERGIADAPDLALGGYAFLWGHKMEATSTWFGMLLDDGSKLAAVDTMTEIWSGSPPADRAPRVDPLQLDGSAELAPREEIRVAASASDPEGKELSARWVLRPDSDDILTGGDFRPEMPELEEAILAADLFSATLRMPEYPGAYRLFYYVYDPAGNAGTASLPLKVKGEVRTRLPFPVYEDSFDGMPWAPSGWMGDTDNLSLDGESTEQVFEGDASIRLRYEGRAGWVGVAWQHPPNDWGDQPGGFDLRGAKALEVWARGQYGGERVEFGVGLLEDDKPYPDSAIVKKEGIVLSNEWTRYEIPLRGKDLSSIKTGFVVTTTARPTPVTFYLDRIRFIE